MKSKVKYLLKDQKPAGTNITVLFNYTRYYLFKFHLCFGHVEWSIQVGSKFKFIVHYHYNRQDMLLKTLHGFLYFLQFYHINIIFIKYITNYNINFNEIILLDVDLEVI